MHGPWAEYAVLDFEGLGYRVELSRLPLDPAELRAIYLESDRPHKEKAAVRYAP